MKNWNHTLTETKKGEVKNSSSESTIESVIERLHSKEGLYLISAMVQIFTGSVLTAIGVLRAIDPSWLSGFSIVLGSLCLIIGILSLFKVIRSFESYGSLLNKAVNRIIDSQN